MTPWRSENQPSDAGFLGPSRWVRGGFEAAMGVMCRQGRLKVPYGHLGRSRSPVLKGFKDGQGLFLVPVPHVLDQIEDAGIGVQGVHIQYEALPGP